MGQANQRRRVRPRPGRPRRPASPRPPPSLRQCPTGPSAGTEVPTSAAPIAVLVGAGDIADCSTDGDEATAKLLGAIPGTVFTLGDNAYEDGSAAEFANCYGPSWGREPIKSRTRP